MFRMLLRDLGKAIAGPDRLDLSITLPQAVNRSFMAGGFALRPSLVGWPADRVGQFRAR
jgi:hypothetical protein